MKNNDKIRLVNLIIYAHHGAHEEERRLGQRFEIDVELGLDFQPAALADDLHLSVDYGTVYQRIHTVVTEKKYYLIEAVAENIAQRLLNDFPIQVVTVCVRKPSVPIHGSLDHVEVEITRERKTT
ncbi:dihydroneopterin aldolase [bacterium]|nr:dihydroneopterin aldolase [bacterium]NUN44121.1 dihydroneopterin aldolase [bacterium]